MVHVAWVLVALFVGSVPSAVLAGLLIRSNHSLVRALIAKTPQEYATLERAAGRVPKRTVPERETDFTEAPIRPMGL